MPALPTLGVQVTTNGAQTPVLTGPAPQRMMILATFPKGPDYPVDVPPSQMATVFGDPSAQTSVGFTGPYLAYHAGQQANPTGAGAITFLVCRGGVGRGMYTVLDGSAGTTMTLRAMGAYAGSNASNLRVSMTVTGGRVTSISFSDTGTLQQVGPSLTDLTVGGTYDLSTNAKIVAAINSTNPLYSLSSVCVATIGASALTPAAVTNAAFTAGTDGRNAPYNDATIGTNGSGGLLDQSLYLPVDFIVTGYDAAQIGPVMLAHIAAAVGQNDPRKAVLGATAGTSFANLSNGTYLGGALSSQRLNVFAHDAHVAVHPATGAQYAFDGFVGAAVHAGMMASGPIEETSINMPVNGIQALNLPPDKTATLQPADYAALTTAGLTQYYQPYGSNAVLVKDNLTTAPQVINGNQINQYAYQNVVNIDDAVTRVCALALRQFNGRPDSPDLAGQMEQAVRRAIGSLGTATNGLNSATFVQNPNTLAYGGTISYKTRSGVRTINLGTGFTNQ